ncbi:MAG: PIN domain-containing protein [Desulfobacterales bacterium]|nr:PIN domain-containing protein [Desulfobacterales bacterium]
MKQILIDTNIYTHAMKGDPDTIFILQRARQIGIRAVSIGELLSGFKGGNQESRNRAELEEFLDSPRVQIYGIDEDTAEFYADILNERGRNNFLNYASQLQATFARSQIPKASK